MVWQSVVDVLLRHDDDGMGVASTEELARILIAFGASRRDAQALMPVDSNLDYFDFLVSHIMDFSDEGGTQPLE